MICEFSNCWWCGGCVALDRGNERETRHSNSRRRNGNCVGGGGLRRGRQRHPRCGSPIEFQYGGFHVCVRTCARWAMKGFHTGLTFDCLSSFHCLWSSNAYADGGREGEGIATNRGGFFFPSSSCLTFPLDIHRARSFFLSIGRCVWWRNV